MANFRNIGTTYDEDLRAPHYTNGRLLTAEDLQSDQRMVLERLAHLGKGAGFGVIDGYRVTAVAGKRDLRITAGIGINRRGDVVRLAAASIDLPVQPISEEEAAVRRSGRFEACEGDEAAPAAALDDGAYLLTVAPVDRLEGSVPRYACDGAETAACANQWEVEGVEFKIIRLTGYTAPTGNRRDRNRNLLAHWFYGSAALDSLMHNPFEFDPAYNGLSKIAAADLSECDLPLAAFFWEDDQIGFVDEWAARRRLIHPYPASAWRANISDQRKAEGEARFVQFQTEAADLQKRFGSKTGDIRAATHFAYLPPVGLLPINPYELILVDAFGASLSEEHERAIAQFKLSNSQVFNRVQTGVLGTSNRGAIFSLARFFGEYLPDDYTIVQEDEIHNRLHQSWVQPAIQLPAPPSLSTGPAEIAGNFFEFTLADSSSVAVTGNNFRTVIGSIQPGIFIASGFSTAEAVEVDSAGTASVDTGGVDTAGSVGGGVAGFRRSAAAEFAADRGYTAAGWSRISRPDWYFVDPAADNEKDAVEPLVDILVIDELLAPYRLQLTKAMPSLITSAITSLISGGGGGFTFGGDLATVYNNVASFMMINAFMAAAANTGTVAMADWLAIQAAAKQPLFYVAFIRYQRERLSRPLRL